jgi:hypothetical protein
MACGTNNSATPATGDIYNIALESGPSPGPLLTNTTVGEYTTTITYVG